MEVLLLSISIFGKCAYQCRYVSQSKESVCGFVHMIDSWFWWRKNALCLLHEQSSTKQNFAQTTKHSFEEKNEGLRRQCQIKCETRQHMIQAYHSTHKSRPHVCVHWGQKRGQASLGLAQYTVWCDYPFTFYKFQAPRFRSHVLCNAQIWFLEETKRLFPPPPPPSIQPVQCEN